MAALVALLEVQVSQPLRIGWKDQVALGVSELKSSTSQSMIDVTQQSSVESVERL